MKFLSWRVSKTVFSGDSSGIRAENGQEDGTWDCWSMSYERGWCPGQGDR